MKFFYDSSKKKKIIKNFQHFQKKSIKKILEKIKAVGFSGLSNEEQSKLYEASKKMSKDSARD